VVYPRSLCPLRHVRERTYKGLFYVPIVTMRLRGVKILFKHGQMPPVSGSVHGCVQLTEVYASVDSRSGHLEPALG
jgi:hypothetical protein